MNRILLVLAGSLVAGSLYAQPKATRAQTKKAKTENKATANDRASLQFPASIAMPEDVVWRRDVYRQLDLKKNQNAALYYPVEPTDGRINLFTYLFRLMLDGRINAYEYRLDGKESFAATDKIKVKEMLDRYHIYYEEKNGKINVDNSDVPSAEVTMYYVKESAYYDQITSTYHRKVVALCPVLRRVDDFGGESIAYPLFWVKYDDISGFLAKAPLMTSNLNNASNMTADDYFTLNKYDGDIYMTNNMQGTILPNDSTRKTQQQHIEKELADFENGVWRAPETKVDPVADSLAAAKNASAKKVKKTTITNSRRASSSSSKTSSKATKSKSSSTSARVSVRRQRH